MKAAAFTYHAAPTLAATCAELADRTDNAKVMGGGQSLGPMLNLRLTRPDAIYDLSKLAELRTVAAQQERVRIGAAVTHAQIEDGEFPALRGGMLQSAAAGIAYRAIRNRGTIGGSLAHADPAADWPAVVIALKAELEIVGPKGAKRISANDFFVDIFTTALEPGEILASIRLPRPDWSVSSLLSRTGKLGLACCSDQRPRLSHIHP